ncbi:CHAP domain-containing protein [Sphingomonas sp. SUN039]|uniref:CHAP domain-containing protein n=1 Tax=Sphingomonas sp. SUN039 TaxID=2937787 RepID=UPI0021640540|nr:CHAP domain-containing protein [Sphingomonas sp. SUN039]UVO54567.1 CHAP domain-containing protein [Sphingomonas sp. SUN039]
MADQPYWQCAAFARQFSGIEIRGDAWTWWGLADGRYAKGQRPRVGAVMSFTPSGRMRLGHVATVTQVLGSREIAVTHANWSPINGTRGQIERDVMIRDVSADNDWSRVRVWYAPLGDLGTTAWPVDGFIYPDGTPRLAEPTTIYAAATVAAKPVPRLEYARLDTLVVGAAPPKGLRLGSDVMRLAMLESRQTQR